MPFTKKQRADRYIEKTMCLIFQTGYPIKTGEIRQNKYREYIFITVLFLFIEGKNGESYNKDSF